jgi:hypothetical protein
VSRSIPPPTRRQAPKTRSAAFKPLPPALEV